MLVQESLDGVDGLVVLRAAGEDDGGDDADDGEEEGVVFCQGCGAVECCSESAP